MLSCEELQAASLRHGRPNVCATGREQAKKHHNLSESNVAVAETATLREADRHIDGPTSLRQTGFRQDGGTARKQLR
jgi:hypothetical protein